MHLHDLSRAMHDFVAAKGWYQPDSPRPQTPRNIAVSLCLESAEVLEHFQWSDQVAEPESLPGELADVALYLLQLASVTGIDLEKAILEKLHQNYTRSWDRDEVK
jgi:NTP pyrophosphatase (non-canonical NTP hydrolase)